MKAKLDKKTLLQLRQDPIYQTIRGRSKMTKSQLVEALSQAYKEFKGTLEHGPFTGTRGIDAIILSFCDHQDLMNVFCTNKYFHSFREYASLWKQKIVSQFGYERVHNYSGTDFMCYYFRCFKHVYGDSAPLKEFNKQIMNTER